MNLYYLLFLSCSRAWEKHKSSTSLVITSIALCSLNCIVFWSCLRAWKKHKLWYKPSDNFFCILIFKLYSILELFTGLEKAQALVQA